MEKRINNRGQSQKMTRFGVSIEPRLLENFDRLIIKKGYLNRSEAIRDIIRDQLVEYIWKHNNNEMIGTINLVYRHGLKTLSEKIAEMQHHNHTNIISTVHVHLDEDKCFEALVVKGKVPDIKDVADRLIGIKGVIHGKLTTFTKDDDLIQD